MDEDVEMKYALVVKKYYLGKGPNFEDLYIFRPVEMLEGMMDEDNITLLNNNGREYYPIESIISGSIENADEAYTECFSENELFVLFNLSDEAEIYNYYKDRLDNLIYIGVDYMPTSPGQEFDLKELKKEELVEFGKDKFALLGDKCIVPLAKINEMLDTNDIETLREYFAHLEVVKENVTEYISQNLEKFVEKRAEEADKEDAFTEEEKKQLEEDILDDVKKYERRKEIAETFEEIPEEDYLTPRERIKKLRTFLKETVIGQDSAIDMMCYVLYKNMKLKDGEKRTSPLLMGPSGSGKTLMLETIGKEMDIPVVIVDANTLSTTGYVGKNITDYLATLIEKAGGNIYRAEHGMVFIDEIDKKGSKENEDVGGKGVINQALKFIEGCEYDVECIINGRKKTVHFNTRNLTVCTSGAFSEVFKKKIDDLRKTNEEKDKEEEKPIRNSIGFNAHILSKKELEKKKEEREEEKRKKEEEKKKEEDDDCKYYKEIKITKKDIADTGKMGTEYAGRVFAIVFNKPSVEDLIEQMERSKSSELTNEIKLLESDNIIFNYTPEFVRKIAEDAYEQGTGGRAVRDIIEQTFSGIVTKILFDDDEYDEFQDYHIYGSVNEDGELSIISQAGEELIERKKEEKEEKKEKGKKVLVKTNDNKPGNQE